MIQVIHDPGIGETLGSALGTGLGGALQFLAQNKLNKMMQQQQQAKVFPALQSLGYSSEEAANLSGLDPAILKEVVKQKLQQPSQESYAQALSSILGGNEQAVPFTQQQFPAEQIVQATQQPTQEQESYIKSLSSLFGVPKPQPQFGASQFQQPQVSQPAVEQKPAGIKIPGGLNQQQATRLAELALKKQEVARKESLQEKQLSSKEQQVINKMEKPFVDKISAYKEAADDSEKRLNKMENLVKKGGLPISSFYNVFKNLEEHVNPAVAAPAGAAAGSFIAGPPGAVIGGTIGGLISPVATLLRGAQKLTSPNAEEFEKLSNDFIRNAKAIFGSRITDQDLRAFLSTVPTLSQTDAGKLAIIKNMKSFNKAAQVKYKVMRDIIKENGNRIPANLEFLVQERAEPQLNKISEEFAVV